MSHRYNWYPFFLIGLMDYINELIRCQINRLFNLLYIRMYTHYISTLLCLHLRDTIANDTKIWRFVLIQAKNHTRPHKILRIWFVLIHLNGILNMLFDLQFWIAINFWTMSLFMEMMFIAWIIFLQNLISFEISLKNEVKMERNESE